MREIRTSGSMREREAAVIGHVPFIPCFPLYSTGLISPLYLAAALLLCVHLSIAPERPTFSLSLLLLVHP